MSPRLVPYHYVTNSEIKSFRGCRQRWNWAYRLGLSPVKQGRPLEFGTAYHKGMEAFYNPNAWDSTTLEEKLAASVDAFSLECIKQRDAYIARLRTDRLPPDVVDEYNERVDLGAGMLVYYATRIHKKYDGWIKPVATEIPFEIPVVNIRTLDSLHCPYNDGSCGQFHASGAEVRYMGRVDMIVEDLTNGGYLLWDFKTTSRLVNVDDFSVEDSFLQLDDQVARYCAAIGLVLGMDIRGFIYQEQRKAFPMRPNALKRVNGGRWFSVSKEQSTDYDEFVAVVSVEDKAAYEQGLYDGYLSFLKSTDAYLFHNRFILRKSEEELKRVLRNLYTEVNDMLDSPLVYPMPGRFSCTTCAYRVPCLAEVRGEDVAMIFDDANSLFYQTDERYWMQESTTSK